MCTAHRAQYLNAKSLTPFLSRTMDGKKLLRIERVVNLGYFFYTYCAMTM